MPKERQRSILGGFWGPFGSPLGGPFRYVGGAVALLGHHLGPKWSQKCQDESPNSDLGLRRGGQGVSEALMGLIWGRFLIVCCVLCGTFACFL